MPQTIEEQLAAQANEIAELKRLVARLEHIAGTVEYNAAPHASHPLHALRAEVKARLAVKK